MILQACKECHRQYDVTHLAPDSRVRCVCDAHLTVKTARLLAAAAHKCTNCGGKIEPGDEACSYCGAELSQLDLARSTLCPECFTRLEDDAKHCKSCGVEISPQALTPLPEHKACPRCKGELGIRSLPQTSVVECSACEGIWFQAEAFEAICRRAQNQPEVSIKSKLEPIGAAAPERKVVYIPCLTCDQLMQRKMFRYKGQPSRVVIDFCRNHGVWLDKDELERIVQFIKSRVDVELPYDPDYRRRPAPARGMVPMESEWGLGTLGTFILADAVGDVLGSVLGELFD